MDEATLDALRETLRRGPALRLALLFGSAARGRLRADSDCDVAIWPEDPTLSLREELDLQRALERPAGRDVDLVRLDRATTLVRWEVALHGVVLFEREVGEASLFVARAAMEHADLMETLGPALEVYRRRVAEGAP